MTTSDDPHSCKCVHAQARGREPPRYTNLMTLTYSRHELVTYQLDLILMVHLDILLTINKVAHVN